MDVIWLEDHLGVFGCLGILGVFALVGLVMVAAAGVQVLVG